MTDVLHVNGYAPEPPEVTQLREEFAAGQAVATAQNWPSHFNDFVERASVACTMTHPGHLRLVRGWAGRLLETAHQKVTAAGGQTATFEQQLNENVNVAAFPSVLTEGETDPVSGKRLPPINESILATIERFKIIERLSTIFGRGIGGIVLAGSMSYGPFFNVRQYAAAGETKQWSSDIDLVATFGPNLNDREGWGSVETATIFDEADREAFIRRVGHFAELHHAGLAQVFTHRFEVAGRDFSVSAHCLPLPVFRALFDDRLRSALRSGCDTTYALDDYKPVPFGRAASTERGFDGSQIAYEVPPQVPVKDGFIARLCGFVLQGANLYPGLYQSNVLPEFRVVHDASGATTEILGRYRAILLERVAEEQKSQPHSSLARAHVRYTTFAPERYDERQGGR